MAAGQVTDGYLAAPTGPSEAINSPGRSPRPLGRWGEDGAGLAGGIWGVKGSGGLSETPVQVGLGGGGRLGAVLGELGWRWGGSLWLGDAEGGLGCLGTPPRPLPLDGVGLGGGQSLSVRLPHHHHLRGWEPLAAPRPGTPFLPPPSRGTPVPFRVPMGSRGGCASPPHPRFVTTLPPAPGGSPQPCAVATGPPPPPAQPSPGLR